MKAVAREVAPSCGWLRARAAPSYGTLKENNGVHALNRQEAAHDHCAILEQGLERARAHIESVDRVEIARYVGAIAAPH